MMQHVGTIILLEGIHSTLNFQSSEQNKTNCSTYYGAYMLHHTKFVAHKPVDRVNHRHNVSYLH